MRQENYNIASQSIFMTTIFQLFFPFDETDAAMAGSIQRYDLLTELKKSQVIQLSSTKMKVEIQRL